MFLIVLWFAWKIHSKILGVFDKFVDITVQNFWRLSICNVFGDRVTIVYKDIRRIAKDVLIETKVIKVSASIQQSRCSWHYGV